MLIAQAASYPKWGMPGADEATVARVREARSLAPPRQTGSIEGRYIDIFDMPEGVDDDS